MANVSLCPTAGAFFQAFTVGGIPLNAGLLYQYGAGGTSPTATYTTSTGNVQNANPIVLGADGRPPNEIWLVNGTAYRFDLYDSASNLIATYDNISGITASTSGSFLPLAGGTMSGNIAMGGFKVTGLAAATVNGDAVRYQQSPAGILSGKGSIITATAASTPVDLPVGSNGQTIIANSSGTNGIAWGAPVLRSYLAGCGLSTAGGSGTMSIGAGTAVDSTNVSAMLLAAIAKTTSAWAVGTGNGGKLSAAGIANNTWYHFYAIQRVDTGVVDAGFDVSATSPTMPTNYTLFRRIGSGLTDGSAHWTAFTQDGNFFQWSVPVLETTSADPGTNAVTQTLVQVPSGISVLALMNTNVNSTENVYLSDLATTDAAPSGTAAPLSNTGNTGSGSGAGWQVQVRTNTSAQIRTRITASGGGQQLRLAVTGWFDTRGRDS